MQGLFLRRVVGTFSASIEKRTSAVPNTYSNICSRFSSLVAPTLGRTPALGSTSGDDARKLKPMDVVREVMGGDGFNHGEDSTLHTADFVHINIKRNNTFVSITDAKGNKKFGASMGCVSELKGGQKMKRYVTESTAEYAGRAARDLGMKSVVVRVKGFTFFRKKRQAIMSFKEGFGDRNPIVYIEDTTRRPHNGCRLPRRRRT